MKKFISLLLCLLVIIPVLLVAIPDAYASTTSSIEDNCYQTTVATNVRKAKSTSSKILGVLKKGETFVSLKIIGQWHKIEYKGQTAYVHTSCTRKTTAAVPDPIPSTTPTIGDKAPTLPPSPNSCYKTTVATNVREAKSTSSKILGVLKKGETFASLEIIGQWHKIEYKGQIAYVHTSCAKKTTVTTPEVKPVPPQEETKPTPTPPVEESVYYTTTNLNVRTGPSSSYKRLGTLAKGTKVVTTGKSGDWYKTTYQGKTAYVHGNYLTKTKPTIISDSSGYPMVYQDSTCTITVYKEWFENAYVYAAHIQYTDYDRLWVECAKGKYNSGKETTSAAAKRVGAILAINGDYATPGNGAGGYAIARNGKVCNDKKTYSEGVYNSKTGMLIYGQSKGISGQQLSTLVAEGKVTDTFQFGPVVLLDGKIQGTNSGSRAQRTFIGTNGKPGDIWLCVSDGRNNDGKSSGLTAYQCGKYLQSKGCTLGVPLDGGGSSTMYFNGKVLNAAKNGQRSVADFVMFK